MKILVVHNRYRSSAPSGEDRVVDQEHAALVAAGHEVQRFERHSDDIAGLSPARRALVPGQVVWSRRAALDLGEQLAASPPDVVHLHNLFPLVSPSVLVAATRARVPCVATFHNYRLMCASGTLFRTGRVCRDCVGRLLPVPGVRHGCYRGSVLATLPVAVSEVAHRRIWRTLPSAYVFLSAAQRREMVDLDLPRGRCFVKPNLVPSSAPRRAAERLVVYLGRLTEAKGLRVLMRAWDHYAAGRPGPALRLAIAGTGPLEAEVRAWARPLPSVDVLGLLDRDRCAALVRRAITVVVPSEWPEPFGLVVAEAMCAGIAPITTATGAFPELVTDGVDGLLYPAGDPGALAGLLRRVEDDPAWMTELGTAARSTYERRFEPGQNVAQLEAIYRFAIENPRWLGDPRRPAGAALVGGRSRHAPVS